jgi:hypothetical protein
LISVTINFIIAVPKKEVTLMANGEDGNSLPLRELLRLSQTDVTEDPVIGLQYAETAYERALGEEGLSDSTAAGEAAAKAAFRVAQGNPDRDEVMRWVRKSFLALSAEDEPTRRERIPTYLLCSRALTLFALREDRMTHHDKIKARQGFMEAEAILQSQHRKNESWDPYATMKDRQEAALEAMFGNPLRGMRVALRGYRRGRQADPARIPPGEQQAFIDKHTKANIAAGALAASRVIGFVPVVTRKRRQTAFKLVG